MGLTATIETSLLRRVSMREKTKWTLCLRPQGASSQVLKSLEAKVMTVSNAVKKLLVLESLLALIPVSTV